MIVLVTGSRNWTDEWTIRDRLFGVHCEHNVAVEYGWYVERGALRMSGPVYVTCQRDGCDEPLTSRHANARYCSDACKSAAYKARTGYTLHATREPCQTRKSSGGPSGLQVSYRKAVEVVADFLTHELAPVAFTTSTTRIAEIVLAQALSDRQLQRLASQANKRSETAANTVHSVVQESGAAAHERYGPKTTGGQTPMAQFRQDTACPQRSESR